MREFLERGWILANQVSRGWIPAPPKHQQTKERVLLVHAHPLPQTSLSGAIATAVRGGLEAAGHDVVYLSLYGTRGPFEACLSADEHGRYLGPTPRRPSLPDYPTPARDAAASVDQLRACTALVFVYPTWWFNVPAVLKGWLDRTFLPGVAFKLPHVERKKDPNVPVRGGLVPGLPNVTKLGIVTTYGAPRHVAFLAGDNGTNMLCRAFLPLFAEDCTVHYHGLFGMDTIGDDQRAAFLAAVGDYYRTRF